jgi:hypothetical protein
MLPTKECDARTTIYLEGKTKMEDVISSSPSVCPVLHVSHGSWIFIFIYLFIYLFIIFFNILNVL